MCVWEKSLLNKRKKKKKKCSGYDVKRMCHFQHTQECRLDKDDLCFGKKKIKPWPTSRRAKVGINPQNAALSCSFGSERCDRSQNIQAWHHSSRAEISSIHCRSRICPSSSFFLHLYCVTFQRVNGNIWPVKQMFKLARASFTPYVGQMLLC